MTFVISHHHLQHGKLLIFHPLIILACFSILGCGTVVTWGWNEHGICGTGNEINIPQPGVVTKLGGSQVSVIGCGGGHSFAVVNR